MANSNFVVHNGLTVGPLTIDAATGAITTSGNISVTGGGSFGGLDAARINSGGSNVQVTASYVNVSVNGSNIASFGAQGIMPTGNASGTLGSATVRWNNVFAVNGGFLSVNANYADLAEKYVADAAYAPGTVLMFGGDKEVTQCVHDLCSRVAGVVSTNPAYLMNSGLEGEHTVELALTGRVPTKVRGPILKGDLIVSAGDGHARAEGLPQVGTVIGKALEDFNGDSGVIEVVVGKH
jgi:hypothetical protein